MYRIPGMKIKKDVKFKILIYAFHFIITGPYSLRNLSSISFGLYFNSANSVPKTGQALEKRINEFED